jgi:hypothetical protein
MRARFFRALAPLALPIAVASPIVSAVAIGACSSDPDPVTLADDGGGSVDGSSTSDGPVGNDDSGSIKDAPSGDTANGDACAPALPPMFDGGNPCGAIDFGLPAAAFGPVQGDGGAYTGGAIPAGIYDAVIGERLSAKGSWRETFVVDGAGKFTRIRQLDLGTDAGPGPIQYRAGTYTMSGSNVKFTYTCAVAPDGGAIDAGSDELPYEVLSGACNAPVYRYGVFGVRVTFRRR